MSFYPHRVYYLNSDMIINNNVYYPGAEYKKTLRLASFDDDYTDVSLYHAVIPNSFPTIQKDVNDSFKFIFTIGYSNKWQEPKVKSVERVLTLQEGFYDEMDILLLINKLFYELSYNEFGISDVGKEHDQWFPVIEGGGDLFDIESDDDNKNKHIKVANKMNVIYVHKDPVYWIEKLEIFTANLSHIILGIPRTNYYCCFKDYVPPEEPDNIDQITYKDVIQHPFPFTILPNRPSLIWVNSVNIRLDIVNVMTDSQVLENIPIKNPELPLITYKNNDILNTSKKFSNNYTNGQVTVTFTQQNGYELNLDNIDFSLDIVVFKV